MVPALSDIGIKVTTVRSGAPVVSFVTMIDHILGKYIIYKPSLLWRFQGSLTSYSIFAVLIYFTASLASDTLPFRYAYMYPFFLGVFSNHPGLPNYGVPDQGVANEESRYRLSTIAQSALAADDLSVFAIAFGSILPSSRKLPVLTLA